MCVCVCVCVCKGTIAHNTCMVHMHSTHTHRDTTSTYVVKTIVLLIMMITPTFSASLNVFSAHAFLIIH